MPFVEEKINIEWSGKSGGLNQVYNNGIEFCLLTEDFKQATKFVLCKDYFQDAFMASYHNKKASVYGFSYDPSKDLPLCLTQTKMAVANSQDSDFSKKIAASAEFLNQIEKQLHLIRTIIQPIANPPKKYEKCGCFAMSASARWQLSPPMLSLYTLLARVSFCHKIGTNFDETIKDLIAGKLSPYQRDDATLMRNAKAGFDKILKHGYAKIFYSDPKRNFPDVDISTMHNNFGIVAFSSGGNSHPKYWHRDLKKKKKVKEEPKEVEV